MFKKHVNHYFMIECYFNTIFLLRRFSLSQKTYSPVQVLLFQDLGIVNILKSFQ